MEFAPFSFFFVLRQLQEARARVAHLFKQTNENVQVCMNKVMNCTNTFKNPSKAYSSVYK